MKVCLLVINYNGLRYLQKHLQNISRACSENDVRLIVSDSGSTDGSLSFLQTNNYEYTVTALPKKGFANNVNHAIRYAMSMGLYDYYIIANNDIDINHALFPVLKKAISTLEKSDSHCGIIGVAEILTEKTEYFDAFDYTAYTFGSIARVADIPGFFMIIADALIKKVGYFDEEYFMYGEDNDFFTRAKKAGFSIYNTWLPVLHYSEGSSGGSKLTSWYVYRNAFLYAQKNLGFLGFLKMFLSFLNQIYNPFFTARNAGNRRVLRNGFLYNNFLLFKSLLWNLRYFLKKHLHPVR